MIETVILIGLAIVYLIGYSIISVYRWNKRRKL